MFHARKAEGIATQIAIHLTFGSGNGMMQVMNTFLAP
jgi:hypothetical protein